MCKWGDSIVMEVTIPSHLSHSGETYKKKVGIDRCIAPLVKAMNEAGMVTDASCCGHGKQPPSIIFNDGQKEKELRIMTFDQARKVDKLFPPIN